MIYRQTRIGKGGVPFIILKLKTMDEHGQVTHPFLRRSGLDELPQIVNILRGEMALFGPRPEVPEKDAYYLTTIPEWRRRYEVKPGLIGLAQVRGNNRGADRFDLARVREKATFDARMIEVFSGSRWAAVLLRLKILAGVPRTLLSGQASESRPVGSLS